MKKSLVIVAVVIGVALLSPSLALAQATVSASTAVNINLPNIVILHYFSTVNVALDAATLTPLLTATNPIDEGVATTATTLNFDLGMAADPLSGGNAAALPLTLRNAWAVRSIGSTGAAAANVAVALTTATLTNGAASITLLTPLASADGTNFAATTTFANPGLVNPEYGDIRVSLNLTSANLAGNYTGGVINITATST